MTPGLWRSFPLHPVTVTADVVATVLMDEPVKEFCVTATFICGDDGLRHTVCVATAHITVFRGTDEAAANAALIAAAPDLYAALAGLMAAVGQPDDGGSDMDAWNDAKAALAKARGEVTG